MAHLGHHDCVICGNYKKFKNLKILYIFEKTVLSIIYSKCENDNEKRFKEEEPIENIILKILGLIKYI